MPYCITAAIVDRKLTTQSFSNEKIQDPKIREVIDRIKGEASVEFDAMSSDLFSRERIAKIKDTIFNFEKMNANDFMKVLVV